MYYHLNPINVAEDCSTLAFGFSIVILIFAVIFWCFIIGMVVFHTYLQATNQTTYENVNDRWKNGNPHGYGCDIFYQLMCSINYSKFPNNVLTDDLVLTTDM